MKKKIIGLICTAMIVLFFTLPGIAQDLGGKIGVGTRLTYMSPSGDTIDGLNVDPDAFTSFGVNGTYFINNMFSVEMSIDFGKTDIEFSVGAYSVDVGELTQTPILLTGRYHIPAIETISPYLGFGIGYYLNSFDLDDAIAGPVDANNSFGYHLNAGAEFFFMENNVFNLDFKYIWNEVEFEGGGDKEDIEMGGFSSGVGYKYIF